MHSPTSPLCTAPPRSSGVVLGARRYKDSAAKSPKAPLQGSHESNMLFCPVLSEHRGQREALILPDCRLPVLPCPDLTFLPSAPSKRPESSTQPGNPGSAHLHPSHIALHSHIRTHNKRDGSRAREAQKPTEIRETENEKWKAKGGGRGLKEK